MNRCNKKSPVRIEGEDKACLTHEVMSTFANTKKRTASVRKELVKEVLPNHELDSNNEAEKIEVSVLLFR